MSSKENTRINKWKSYRKNILENNNIEESIINEDIEIKEIINEIDFDINELFDKNESDLKSKKSNSYKQEIDSKTIDEFLEQIHRNEIMKTNEQIFNDFNSHKYDINILDNFSEFQSDDFSDTATTDLRIKKISLANDEGQTNMNKKINIAIDGTSGVGKSTISKTISKIFNLLFVNTGLMYRAIAYYCIQNQIDLENKEAIKNSLKDIKIELLQNETIKLNDEDITLFLWNDKISLSSSIIAKYEEVRTYCVELQQKIANEKYGVVMEGRDIGTVVLPNADIKIFLTATPEIRAQRRIAQLKEKKQSFDEQEVLKNIIKRDKADIERKNAPLLKASDAIEIDTSFLTLEEVINKIVKLIEEKMI